MLYNGYIGVLWECYSKNIQLPPHMEDGMETRDVGVQRANESESLNRRQFAYS